MNEEEELLIWQLLTFFGSCGFISIISISSSVAGCSKKKEKLVESVCSKRTQQLQIPSSNILSAPQQDNKSKPPSTPVEPKSNAKPDEKKPDEASKEEKKEKGDEKKNEEEKKPNGDEKKPEAEGTAEKTNVKTTDEKKGGTKEGGTGATKDATKEGETKLPPESSPKPQQGQPQQQQQPKEMEVHKSMKVRKKKTPSPAPSPAVAATGGGKPDNNNKTKVSDIKTKGTTLKAPNNNNDGGGGDDDDEDDDETLRGVTSLKVDPKVPFSVDEPAP